MITLYGYGEKIGVRDPSPFCLKVQTYMRMTGIEYNTYEKLSNLQKAPKGKLPFIIDNPKNNKVKRINKKGITVADSSFIVDYLKTSYSADLDAWLTDEHKATSYLVMKSLEENFYFCLMYARWIDDAGWADVEEPFFGELPGPLRLIISKVARKSAFKQAHAQGISRHSREEVHSIANKTIDALAAMLGDKPYFMGDAPCTLDACAFGFLAQAVLCTKKPFWAVDVLAHENLVAFCERIESSYFTE